MQVERPTSAHKVSISRILLGGGALAVLVVVYLFQHTDFWGIVDTFFFSPGKEAHPYFVFSFNKAMRLLLNDLACFVLIFAIFNDRKYLTVAYYVFLMEFLLILPSYLWLKLTLEGDSELSSPLLSQIHRLIINPTLMFTLIAAFFYQRQKNRKIYEK